MTQAFRKHFICFAVSFLFLSAGILSANAEEADNPFLQPRVSRYDTMKQLKDDIAALISENKKLKMQYFQLKQQWEILQIQDQTKEEQAVQVEYEPSTETAAGSADQKQTDSAGDSVEESLLNLQQQDQSAKLAVRKEQLTLLELHLADLQYQRKELELELKMLKVQNQDKERKILELKEKENIALQEAAQTERQLLDEIARKEETLNNIPNEVLRLEHENSELEGRITALQKQNELKDKERNILKDKLLLKEKSLEYSLSKIQKEQSALKDHVDNLNKEHDRLSQQIKSSLSLQQRKNELIQGIKRYDQENQSLRVQIDEIEQTLKNRE